MEVPYQKAVHSPQLKPVMWQTCLSQFEFLY